MTDDELQSWLQQYDFSDDDLNVIGRSGLTPLMRAARLGDIEVAGMLLARGASISIRNRDGNNAIWFACVGEHLPMIEWLSQRGIDVDNQNDNGASCLMYASSTGKETVLQTLLAIGANPNLKSLDDFTALDVAASYGCLQLLRRREKTAMVM